MLVKHEVDETVNSQCKTYFFFFIWYCFTSIDHV